MSAKTAADVLQGVMDHHVATGELLVPDGAPFVDADTSRAGQSIAEAIDEGRPVVLVTPDGNWRVIPAPSSAAG